MQLLCGGGGDFFTPGGITQQAEQAADAPGDAGGPPDAPEAYARDQYDQQRQGDAADDLHHAVDEGEEGVANAVEDAAADVDDRKEQEEPAGQTHCTCAVGDDGLFLDEELHYRGGKELEEQHAVAEACGYYFDAKGKVVYETRSIGIDFNEIDQMDCIIVVAGGKKKAESLLAVSHSIPNGIFVTDEEAATEMLRLAGK